MAAPTGALADLLDAARALDVGMNGQPEVGGAAVGYAGAPHPFYRLYREVQRVATPQELRTMLHEGSPVVRILAAKCLLKDGRLRPEDEAALAALVRDPTPVMVGPGGCVFLASTVGEVVRALRADPEYLGEWDKARAPRTLGERDRSLPDFSGATRAELLPPLTLSGSAGSRLLPPATMPPPFSRGAGLRATPLPSGGPATAGAAFVVPPPTDRRYTLLVEAPPAGLDEGMVIPLTESPVHPAEPVAR